MELHRTGTASLLSGIYVLVGALLGALAIALGNVTPVALLLLLACRLVVGTIYFWLLYRIGCGAGWWTVMLLGIVVLMITP